MFAIQLPVAFYIAVTGSFDAAAAVGLLIQLVFTVVLGAIPGNRGPNRFGPAPGQPTPIAASETFR
jgi:uncharacterized membrane protein YhaH (DUF805 family)